MKFSTILIVTAGLATSALATPTQATSVAEKYTPLYKDCTFWEQVTTSAVYTVTVWKTTHTSTYSLHCFGCALSTTTVPGSITITKPATVTATRAIITTIETVCSIE